VTAIDETSVDPDDVSDEEITRKQLGENRATGRWNSLGMPTERSKDLGSTVRRLTRLLGKEQWWLVVILVIGIVSATLNVFGPRVLGRGTDTIIEGVQSGLGIDTGKLHGVLLLAAGLYITSAALAILNGFLIAGVVQRLMFDLRAKAEDKINSLPLAFVDRSAKGDLLSRVTNDLDNLSQSLQQTMSQSLNSILLLIGVTVMMFVISPLLAIVAYVTVPVSLWSMKRVANRAKPRFLDQWRHTGSLNAQIEETFTGHAIVKAFGRQKEVEQRFEETNDELYEASFGAQFASALSQPITMFLGNVQYVIVAVVGGLRVTANAITVGQVQAFIQYSRTFSMPLTQLASMLNMFQSGMASLERVLELLDADEQSPEAMSVLTAPAKGRVEFRDVTFSYSSRRKLIEHLDLVAEPGQTIAVVGPTGAGKTTLVNLLMRFYELDGGAILLDGHDIAEMPRAELRANLGMVLQDTWLFGGTIRDNIAYGNPDATEDDILEAARACYVDRFVHSLPDGYDTLINEEGDNISAGQKQLLTIARAFLAKRSILILDEATSSVDTRTEVQIQVAMNRLRKDRTSFVIAHRLSTIRGADTILVMDAGKIVEQGSHEELLSHDGPYFRLYNSQFTGALLAEDEST
jgi:ATP-binding cassette subfamily B multidrug efflux pump